MSGADASLPSGRSHVLAGTPLISALESAVVRKIFVRLVPLLIALYFLNCVDRANISIAALTMNKDLGMSPVAFGIGSGVFFFGYIFFEVPINILLERIGARICIAVMMIVWGFISAATGLINGAHGFYIVRFLLGLAEAGFFPGMIFYLSCWFPTSYRARIIGLCMLSYPLSNAIGSPISSYLLVHCNGLGGLEGWRWLFFLEGLPTVLLGIACFWVLTDLPRDAHWLNGEEKTFIQSILGEENRRLESVQKYSVLSAMFNGWVILLCCTFFFIVTALYGSIFWIPQVLATLTKSNMEVGLLTSVPYFAAGIVMYFWSRHSDAQKERIWHIAGSTALSAIGFFIVAIWINSPIITIIGLSLACIGIYSTLPVFWTLPTSFLTGPAAAACIALITSVANTSGIIVPPLIGYSKQVTGNFSAAMWGMGGSILMASILCQAFRIKYKSVQRQAAAANLPAV